MRINKEDIKEFDEMVEICKELTGNDNKLIVEYQLLLAVNSIKNYLNYPTHKMFDESGGFKFLHETIQFTEYLIQKHEQGGIVSKTQGQRSVTYSTNSSTNKLPPHIIDMLPLPLVGSV